LRREPLFSSEGVGVFGREERKLWPVGSPIKWMSEKGIEFDKTDKWRGK